MRVIDFRTELNYTNIRIRPYPVHVVTPDLKKNNLKPLQSYVFTVDKSCKVSY